MSNTIVLHIDRAEGSLQRLIGLIERRGFHIERMTINDAGSDREVRVSVSPRDTSRCTDLLGRQIDRLIGARRIVTTTTTAHVEEAVPCPA